MQKRHQRHDSWLKKLRRAKHPRAKYLLIAVALGTIVLSVSAGLGLFNVKAVKQDTLGIPNPLNVSQIFETVITFESACYCVDHPLDISVTMFLNETYKMSNPEAAKELPLRFYLYFLGAHPTNNRPSPDYQAPVAFVQLQAEEPGFYRSKKMSIVYTGEGSHSVRLASRIVETLIQRPIDDNPIDSISISSLEATNSLRYQNLTIIIGIVAIGVAIVLSVWRRES